MKITVALYGSLFLAAIFLGGGYALASNWLGIISVLMLAACWAIAGKFRWSWMNSVVLAGYVSASAGGILLGLPPHLFIAGSAFALAAWEVSSQDSKPTPTPIAPLKDTYRQKSLKLLALSIGLGLLVAEYLLFVRVPIPFAVLLFAVLLGLFGLYMFFRTLKSY